MKTSAQARAIGSEVRWGEWGELRRQIDEGFKSLPERRRKQGKTTIIAISFKRSRR